VKNAELPEGVWQRVFCAGRHLPHLTYLGFDALDGETAAWDAVALASLVNSCPNLREMLRMLPLQPGRYVSQLQQLTALTRLNVLYEECDVPSLQSSLEGLAAVTQLRDLIACLETYGLSRALLLPLTRLTTLTALEFNSCFQSHDRDAGVAADGDDNDSGSDEEAHQPVVLKVSCVTLSTDLTA
jgi:hypothetical protein